VEHWDNLQEASAGPSPSGHTMTDWPTTISDADRTEANKALMKRYMDDLLAGQRETFPSYFDGSKLHSAQSWSPTRSRVCSPASRRSRRAVVPSSTSRFI